ncbi:MAG: type II toxin-antitoxin system prevent-host-death family antitoxin [Treponema sp.]|jgi:prevent-host-death family protein|nr:type II toxin-antitoxin system prevent-host-death family antitoxin [Treponema sp.]
MKSTTIEKRKTEWQLQEAKAMFSEVIQSAALKPQIITVRGKKTAVIISYEEYRQLSGPKQNLFNFIRNSPLFGIELELPQRIPEETRELNL